MSDENPFAAMMQLGQDWAKQMHPAVESLAPGAFPGVWPTMPKDAMEAFFGKGLNPDGLDAKTRLLLTLNGLVIAGAAADDQIRLTVRHAVAAGATKQEIAETIAQAAMFGGVPAMTKAMKIATDVLEQEDDA